MYVYIYTYKTYPSPPSPIRESINYPIQFKGEKDAKQAIQKEFST